MKFVNIQTVLTCLILSSTLAACGGGSAKNDENDKDKRKSPVTDNSNYKIFDASSSEKFLDLSSGHTVTKSENWHISYKKYRGFTVNGGVSGSGQAEGCIAKSYPQLYDAKKKPVKAEFEKLNATNTLDDFKAVTKESCSNFIKDSLKTQIKMADWLDADYSKGAPIFSASTKATNGWLIRSSKADANGDYKYAKVKVKTVTYTTSPVKRAIVLQSKQYDANATAFAANWTDSPELDFTSERVYWDLDTNTKVAAGDDWDLSVTKNGRNWDIQLNSSVSGSGNAALGVLQKLLSEITDPKDEKQVYKYFVDSTQGVLLTPGNYGPLQYGVYGRHKMTPNFTTYLIKDGAKTYKFQVLGNYGKDGKSKSGNIYVRYSELTD